MADKKVLNPLASLGKIKEVLCDLFMETSSISDIVMFKIDNENYTYEQNWYGGKYNKDKFGKANSNELVGHCFTVPYVNSAIMDNRCIICMESYLTELPNDSNKRISLEISVLCHRSSVKLTDEETEKYHELGMYGNRIDVALQAINLALLDKKISDKFGIGRIRLRERNPVIAFSGGVDFHGKSLCYIVDDFYLTSSYRNEVNKP